MSGMRRFALALLIIGGINWGLIGFFRFDLVATLFGGQGAFLSRVVYGLVGISALVSLGLLFKPNEEMEPDRHYRRVNDLNLNTEFGEEPDFKKTDNDEKKKETKNKNQPSTKKRK